MSCKVIIEGNAVRLMIRARLISNGEYVTIDDIHAISVCVYNADTLELVDCTTFDPEYYVFDTLQTSDEWRSDEVGYNIALPIPGTMFPDGATNYVIEYVIDPYDGYPRNGKVKVRTDNLLNE